MDTQGNADNGGDDSSMTQNYNFAPVGPFALKESADRTAGRYGGKVVPVNSIYGGIGYYIVPLNMNENFEVVS